MTSRSAPANNYCLVLVNRILRCACLCAFEAFVIPGREFLDLIGELLHGGEQKVSLSRKAGLLDQIASQISCRLSQEGKIADLTL